jgi:hypothetical protein
MSPASYQTAPPRAELLIIIRINLNSRNLIVI